MFLISAESVFRELLRTPRFSTNVHAPSDLSPDASVPHLCFQWPRGAANLQHVSAILGVSQKGSRERCLPAFFWKSNGKKRKKTEKKRKKTERKQGKEGKNGRKRKKTGKKEKIGSDTIPATPFAKPRNTWLERTSVRYTVILKLSGLQNDKEGGQKFIMRFFLLAPLQKLVSEIFWVFCREKPWKIKLGCNYFDLQRMKARNLLGNIRRNFRKKLRNSKKKKKKTYFVPTSLCRRATQRCFWRGGREVHARNGYGLCQIWHKNDYKTREKTPRGQIVPISRGKATFGGHSK